MLPADTKNWLAWVASGFLAAAMQRQGATMTGRTIRGVPITGFPKGEPFGLHCWPETHPRPQLLEESRVSGEPIPRVKAWAGLSWAHMVGERSSISIEKRCHSRLLPYGLAVRLTHRFRDFLSNRRPELLLSIGSKILFFGQCDL